MVGVRQVMGKKVTYNRVRPAMVVFAYLPGVWFQKSGPYEVTSSSLGLIFFVA
jgi:hypothetical protein